MCQISGEVADGMRPHPICTRKYIQDVMLPAIQKGADKAGRPAEAVEVCASPLLVTAPDEKALEQRIRNVRARISFYASTRTYRAVFEHHGWGDLVPELSLLSRQQRWEEMPQQITDEMLETIAIVGTYDQIAERVWKRYEGVATRVEFSIPVRNDTDRGQLREMIQDLRRAG
jgi:alkanesulfonate monooxygenase SsuD/methylene tetrahydromethanopterin reductase-like flavin-dependent oxidoreductase (luciferase family)